MNFLQFGLREDDIPEDMGAELAQWESYDSHPQERSMTWKVGFVTFLAVVMLLIFWGTQGSGSSNGSFWTDMTVGNIIMVFALFLSVGVYFWVHKNGTSTHVIQIYENALCLEGLCVPKNLIEGYWFLVKDGVSLLKLEIKNKKSQKIETISLQMGDETPQFFRDIFDRCDVQELMDREESVLDMCIRIFKL